jgi:FAD:protein FMN transferase
MQIKIGLGCLLLIVFFSCAKKQQRKTYLELQGYTVGTTYLIQYDANSGNLKKEIGDLFAEMDRSINVSNPSSVLSKMNSNDSGVTVNNHISALFNLSSQVYKETEKAFDPTIEPVVSWWGKDVKKFIYPELVDSSTFDSLKALTGFSDLYASGGTVIKKRSGIQLNFRNIYEGYMADKIADLLNSYNVLNYRIEIGGKLKTKGNDQKGKPWEIGLDDPTDNAKRRPLLAVAPLNGNGFAMAGSYRDFYTKGEMKLSFTIDPATLRPVDHTLISAAVFAPSAAEAQAYANAFLVMGVEKTKIFLRTHPKLQAYLISTNYKGEWITYLSDGLNEQVEFVKEMPK